MSKLNSKQGIINTLLACMDYNKPDDTWHIKANGIDDLASDLEDKFNNVDLADVSNRRELLIAFVESVDQEYQEEIDNGRSYVVVDNYLKAIDCG